MTIKRWRVGASTAGNSVTQPHSPSGSCGIMTGAARKFPGFYELTGQVRRRLADPHKGVNEDDISKQRGNGPWRGEGREEIMEENEGVVKGEVCVCVVCGEE